MDILRVIECKYWNLPATPSYIFIIALMLQKYQHHNMLEKPSKGLWFMESNLTLRPNCLFLHMSHVYMNCNGHTFVPQIWWCWQLRLRKLVFECFLCLINIDMHFKLLTLQTFEWSDIFEFAIFLQTSKGSSVNVFTIKLFNDDVVKWQFFSHHRHFVRGIHP